jgi:hypothetical protein
MNAVDDLVYLRLQCGVAREQIARLRPEEGLMRINLESRVQLLKEEIAALEQAKSLEHRTPASIRTRTRAAPVRARTGVQRSLARMSTRPAPRRRVR